MKHLFSTDEFQTLQEAFYNCKLNEVVQPRSETGKIIEDSDTYNRVQKLLSCPEMEEAHGFLYDIDFDHLNDGVVSKVDSLYNLAIDKGFLKDENVAPVEEPDFSQDPLTNDGVKSDKAPFMDGGLESAYTCLYSAMKDGELKTGECFSNAKDSQSAKADAISKLANLGFTSIEIIAIEQGDPASRGTPNVSNVGDVETPEFINFMDKPEVEDVSVKIDEKEEKKSEDESDSEETEEDSNDEKKKDFENDSEDKEKSEDNEDEKSEKKKITEDLEEEEWETSEPFFSEQGELIRKIPDECVHDCVVPGHDATAACSRWVEALNFKEGLDIPMAKAYLKSLGAWTEDEIRALSDTEVAEMILWVVCGDIVDGETLITIGDEGRFEESTVTEEKDETEETAETEETETTEENPASDDPLLSDVKDETSEEETEDSDGSEEETEKETEEETVEEEPSEEEDKTEETPEETPTEDSEKPEEKEDSKEDKPKDGELSKAEVLEMVEKFVNNWKQTLKNMDKVSFKDLTIKERSKFFKDLDDQWEDKEHDPSDFISEKNWEMLMDLEIVL